MIFGLSTWSDTRMGNQKLNGQETSKDMGPLLLYCFVLLFGEGLFSRVPFISRAESGFQWNLMFLCPIPTSSDRMDGWMDRR